jgi:adenine-specific DNA-methyltransferase
MGATSSASVTTDNGSYQRLRRLLDELFQFDQADLDFGIYRIMNQKRAEIGHFLDEDLLPQVRATLADFRAGEQDALQGKLDKLRASLQAAGVRPESAPRYRELQEQLAGLGAGAEIENEVYSDLYTFFRRYYQEGDFISLRRYKAGVYAIPYEGEEVKLHWANADQYYVKTTEAFQDYRFRLPDGRHVHFRLVAAETERDNNKAADEERRFFLRAEEPTAEVDGELHIRFEYRPSKRDKQKDLNDQAVETLLGLSDLRGWREALATPQPTASDKNRSLLAKHLADYTAKNSFDYFIHKDLGGFLRRELDFFLKNEVAHLDDLDTPDERRADQYLARLRAIKRIGHKIIDFLAQLEDFQKRLFLKKKFVVAAEYCMTLDREPETLYPQIVVNEEQWIEWVRLFKVDELHNADDRAAVMRENQNLVLDTGFFGAGFKTTLFSSFEDLDGSVNGLLVNADNLQAMELLSSRFREQIRCIYIDPPFNTNGDGFLYKDSYRHSSWLSFMANRLKVATELLTNDGTLYAHIDYNEKEKLRLLLDQHLNYITEIIWRIGWLSGYKTKANKFIRNHDTIYQYGKSERPLFVKTYIPYPDDYTRRDGSKPEGHGYPLEDTWNCSEIDSLNSIQIVSFSREKLGNDQLTQKNESLIERMLVSSSKVGDWVLDYFLGSGTTCAAAQKMGLRWIGVEAGRQFDDFVLPRLKRVLFGDRYGISTKYDWKCGGMFKYLRLESYEDSLNNLRLRERPSAQQRLVEQSPAAREDYLLSYCLNLETEGSASLLDLERFANPFDYQLTITQGGESQTVAVDLPETFNYLLGLRVRRIRTQDGFHTVEGDDPEDKRVLVIWRSLNDSAIDNEALENFFAEQGYADRATENSIDRIYVNGDNTLLNLRTENASWQVLLTEEEFKRLMFASTGEGGL